jgi:hypothetical protein
LPKVFIIKNYFNVIKIFIYLEFSERVHAEAAAYMMSDHEDNPDFPDHFTYYPYDKEKTNKRLDYLFERLFKEKYLDCNRYFEEVYFIYFVYC